MRGPKRLGEIGIFAVSRAVHRDSLTLFRLDPIACSEDGFGKPHDDDDDLLIAGILVCVLLI